MAYIECKIWPFSNDLKHQEKRWEAMKAGHRHYIVKAMIDTSSSVNFISRSLADKLGRKYGNYYKNKKVKNSLGTIDCLDLSLRYKGKDRLLSGSDEIFNDFEVTKKPCVDLVLGLPWLWLREAEIDIRKEGIKIYGYFVPFCKYPNNDKSFHNSDSETESSDPDSSDSDTPCEMPIGPEKKRVIPKKPGKIIYAKKSGNKKVNIWELDEE